MVKLIMVYKIAYFIVLCQVLGQFIARAIANACLPESFVVEHLTGEDSDVKYVAFFLIAFRLSLITERNICDNVGHGCCRVALNKAEVLLKMNNGLTRLESVWGVGDGSQSYLSNQIVMLVKEYLVSADAVEATRCLMDLDVPHYHHELVYQVSVLPFVNMLFIVLLAKYWQLSKDTSNCGSVCCRLSS
jgi:hypothetical protein